MHRWAHGHIVKVYEIKGFARTIDNVGKMAVTVNPDRFYFLKKRSDLADDLFHYPLQSARHFQRYQL